MYKLCKTEQSATRQRQLEMGLLQIMMTRRYDEISISDLCQQMQIPRKSFYRYFSSKDGALFALLDHTMLQFYEEGFRTSEKGNPLGDLDAFFVFWYAHRDLLEALERSKMSGLLVERATELAKKERLVPALTRGWDASMQQVALSFAICGLMAMVTQWHHDGYRLHPREMSEIAKTMLTRPLVPL